MWFDNETERDFLNFTGVADAIAAIIRQSQGQPVSIGVSGAWGTGKSSMLKLIRGTLEAKLDGDSDILIVEFNAWLYQGYDDARAALLHVIASALEEKAKEKQTGLEKVRELIGRIDLMRLAKLTAGPALAIAFGLSPIGIIGEIVRLGRKIGSGDVDQQTISDMENAAVTAGQAMAGIIKSGPDSSPPKEIQAIRTNFEEALSELKVSLVVLIDDLDRCLPPTTISTLEAIRLFLFLRNTAFVIAADPEMIKHAVRQHFEGADDTLATNYFDKLIQVPIRVPPLGTQEVRAYMMLLFVDAYPLSPEDKEAIRAKVAAQLKQTWQGKRVDRAFMMTLREDWPNEMIGKFDTADCLAPLMTTASHIAGNPRLIKRFLNALAIRMSISQAQGVGVDEAALAKMLLFERLGSPRAYESLIQAVNSDDEGKPRFLAEWEEVALADQKPQLDGEWDNDFIRDWLTVPPRLANLDLRGVLYVSREHAPLISPEDRLSSDAAELLAALLDHPDMADSLKEKLDELQRPELAIIMDRLLERARQEQRWGVPPILNACLVVTETDPGQGLRLAAFLQERPPLQIEASIVKRIGDRPWAKSVFNSWSAKDVSDPVRNAIAQER